jgi:hypothetical protein
MESTNSFDDSFDHDTKVYQVYLVLKDQQWHCRECEYTHTGVNQIAGGAGIQGLQRGTKSRSGMQIESSNQFCVGCDRTTRHDRWQGNFQSSVQGASMPASFARKVVRVLGARDIIEGTERPLNQLTVDHKFPMIRWSAAMSDEQTNYADMDDVEIRAKFQLLKKSNGSVSHNLLKSQACVRCYRTGRRGEPFGVAFFYAGGPNWEPTDRQDPKGCEGCGWYYFDLWRNRLNERLNTGGRSADAT